MAETARAWSVRPSSLLPGSDEVHAYLIDEALAVRLQVEMVNALDDKRPTVVPPAGTTFATDADYPPDPSGPVAPGPAAVVEAA